METHTVIDSAVESKYHINYDTSMKPNPGILAVSLLSLSHSRWWCEVLVDTHGAN